MKLRNKDEQKAYKAAVRAIWEDLSGGWGEPFKNAEYSDAILDDPTRLAQIEALVIADIKKLVHSV